MAVVEWPCSVFRSEVKRLQRASPYGWETCPPSTAGADWPGLCGLAISARSRPDLGPISARSRVSPRGLCRFSSSDASPTSWYGGSVEATAPPTRT